MTRIKLFCAYVVTTNSFAYNYAKSLQIYYCVKCQAKKTTFRKMSKGEQSSFNQKFNETNTQIEIKLC